MASDWEQDEVFRALNSWIPKRPPDYIIEDSVFLEIENVLGSHSSTLEWKARPRLYCLLRMAGLDHESPVLQSFLAEDIHDISLPFREIYVPRSLRVEPELLEKFLSLQMSVCTPSVLMNASNFTNRALIHRYIMDGRAHFEELENLGSGGSASVHRVRHKLSGQFFARKKMLRGNGVEQQKRKLVEFQKELKALRKLRHTHLVNYVGSYTDLWSFCMILSPVADALKSTLYRHSIAPLTREVKSYLRDAFGCIATAISYCHEQQVRHKDVKPGNILFSDGLVYLCDFGISHDWSGDSEQATTEGDPGRYTLRYSAPEVVNHRERNEKSDIWSLGCVYLEMISVIKGYTMEQLDQFMQEGDLPPNYWCQVDSVHSWLDKVKDGGPDDAALEWIGKMVQMDPSARPTAKAVVDLIQNHFQNTVQNPRNNEWFIGHCCIRSLSTSSPMSHGSRSGSSVGPLDLTTSSRLEGTPTHLTAPYRHPFPVPPVPSAESPPESSRSDSRDRSALQVPQFRQLLSWSNPSTSPPSQSDPPQDYASPPISHRGQLSTNQSGSLNTPRSSHDGAEGLSFRGQSLQSDLSALRIGLENSSTTLHEITGENLECPCGAQSNELQLFEAPLFDLSIAVGLETAELGGKCYSKNSALRIYETRNDAVWNSTRRLVISRPTEESSPQCISFWLPLTNIWSRIRSGSQKNELTLWWSDCNHLVKKKPRNYEETWDHVYDPLKSNHEITVHMETEQAELLIAILLRPSGDTKIVRKPQNQMQHQVRVSDTQMAYLYNVARISQQSGRLSLDFRMLALTEVLAPSIIHSKLYSVYPDFDLEMQLIDDEIRSHGSRNYRFAVKITSLTSPMYISNRTDEPINDPKKIARCGDIREIPSTAVLNFPIGTKHLFPTPPESVVNLLKGLTAWTITFFSAVEVFKVRRKFNAKDHGSGDLIIWQTTNRDGRWCQLAFRMHPDSKRDPTNERRWTTGTVKRDSNLDTSGPHKAKLQIFNRASGSLLDMTKMIATNHSHQVESKQHHHHRVLQEKEESSDMTITFKDTASRQEFSTLIEKFKESAAHGRSGSSSVHRSRVHPRTESRGSEVLSPSLTGVRTWESELSGNNG